MNVVYLIHIENNLYKFGWSSNFEARYKDHKNKRGWTKVIEVFDAYNSDNARNAETKFKRYLNNNKLLVSHTDRTNSINTEIFKVDGDITHIIATLKEYVSEEVENGKKKYTDYYEKELALKKLDLELSNSRLKEIQEKYKPENNDVIIKALKEFIDKNLKSLKVKYIIILI